MEATLLAMMELFQFKGIYLNYCYWDKVNYNNKHLLIMDQLFSTNKRKGKRRKRKSRCKKKSGCILSDLEWSNTYIDRADQNKTKKFNHNSGEKNQWPLLFQQAVDKMPPKLRHSVHIRLLLKLKRQNGINFHAAEEFCICNPSWPHSCISTFSVSPSGF